MANWCLFLVISPLLQIVITGKNTTQLSSIFYCNVSNVKIWSQCFPNGSLLCGDSVGKNVKCSEDGKSLLIKPCTCVHYDTKKNISVAGHCSKACFNYITDVYYSLRRYEVENATRFNDDMCNKDIDLHREGRFCGSCKHGHGLVVYSYDYRKCTKCSFRISNLLKYFVISLIPLTVFYILVISLKVNVSLCQYNGVLFVIQSVLSPLILRMVFAWLASSLKHKAIIFLLKAFLSIVTIANLDFFRGVYNPFCLHPDWNVVHLLSLEYLVALYPFFLIFCTYVLISLHDRGCPPIIGAWALLKRCHKSLAQFNVHFSLAETFATFILLSSVKILGISFEIMAFVRAYAENGTELDKHVYYDANIDYLDPQHYPFAVLALIMAFVFVVLPFLLLLFYPCSCFQKCLNYSGWNFNFLHVFMDAFQGGFRIEPYFDMRYISAWYLFLRFLLLCAITSFSSASSLPVVGLVMIFSGALIAILQPYKNTFHNKMDVLLMLSSSLMFVALSADVITSVMDYHHISYVQPMVTTSVVLVMLCMLFTVLWIPCGASILKMLFYVARRIRSRGHTRLVDSMGDSYGSLEALRNKELTSVEEQKQIAGLI